MMALSTGLQAKTKAEKAGWKIAVQSYTFHQFSLQEALDKCQELGIKYIEVYPGHKLGEGYGDLSFGPDLEVLAPEEYRNQIVEKVNRTLELYKSMQGNCIDGG